MRDGVDGRRVVIDRLRRSFMLARLSLFSASPHLSSDLLLGHVPLSSRNEINYSVSGSDVGILWPKTSLHCLVLVLPK